MTKSFVRFTFEQIEEAHRVYRDKRKDEIFLMMYPPLYSMRTDNLQPEEVWSEANRCIMLLRDVDDDERDSEVFALHQSLVAQYRTFCSPDGIVTHRTEKQAEHTAMMVMLAVFFMLLDKHPTIAGHPHLYTCQTIKQVIKHTDGFQLLYEGCRQEEDKLERRGKEIPIKDYFELADIISSRKASDRPEDLALSSFINACMRISTSLHNDWNSKCVSLGGTKGEAEVSFDCHKLHHLFDTLAFSHRDVVADFCYHNNMRYKESDLLHLFGFLNSLKAFGKLPKSCMAKTLSHDIDVNSKVTSISTTLSRYSSFASSDIGKLIQSMLTH